MLNKINFTAQNTLPFKKTQFFRLGLWFCKLENHFNSQVSEEVANKLKGY